MRLLLWAAIGVLVVMWLLRLSKTSSKPSSTTGAPDNSSKTDKTIEPMLQCVYCGIHVPASEAVAGPSGAAFCSEEHRLKHVRS